LTGSISGLALETVDTTTYTVFATNEAGSTSTSLSIVVTQIPPQRLAYTSRFARYTVGDVITDVPTVLPGVDTASAGSYVFSAVSLPDGFQLNETTGVLSGVASDESDATTYTITVSNEQGSLSQKITIEVVGENATEVEHVATIQLTLSDYTVATFTDNVQALLKSQLASALGLNPDQLTLVLVSDSSTASSSFATQSSGVSVLVIIDVGTTGDASQVTSYLNEQVEADEFALASFSSLTVNTSPVLVSSSTASGVVSSSTGLLIATESTDNEFEWSSLPGMLLVVLIIGLIIGVFFGVWWYCRRGSRAGTTKGKLFTGEGETNTTLTGEGETGEATELTHISYKTV